MLALEKNRSISLVLVPCTISRGGFSGERVFSIGQIKGVSPKSYCYDEYHEQVGDDIPPEGHTISGFIVARLLDPDELDHASELTVSLPSGDVVTLPANFVERP